MMIVFNGKIIDEDLVKISPLSMGFSYGDGFFTTIKVIDRVPQLIELHIDRIKSSLSYFSFDLKMPDLYTEIGELLKINNLNSARVKVTFFRDLKSISYLITCSELIINIDPVDLKLNKSIRGDDPIYRFKSLNYFSNLKTPFEIYKDWRDRILETGFANIFIIKDNIIYTPPKSLPLLPGVYREHLLNKGQINGLPIKEKIVHVSELKECDAIFLTNSIRGILPVKSYNDIPVSTKIYKMLLDIEC